jgi:hypothetical protein
MMTVDLRLNPLVPRTPDLLPCVLFGRQWPDSADHNRWVTARCPATKNYAAGSNAQSAPAALNYLAKCEH